LVKNSIAHFRPCRGSGKAIQFALNFLDYGSGEIQPEADPPLAGTPAWPE
jgi:hypothetical protein